LARVYFASARPPRNADASAVSFTNNPNVDTSAFKEIAPDARAIVPSSWGEYGIVDGQLWNDLIIEFAVSAFGAAEGTRGRNNDFGCILRLCEREHQLDGRIISCLENIFLRRRK
jgi:hypothetical protein